LTIFLNHLCRWHEKSKTTKEISAVVLDPIEQKGDLRTLLGDDSSVLVFVDRKGQGRGSLLGNIESALDGVIRPTPILAYILSGAVELPPQDREGTLEKWRSSLGHVLK